MTSVGFWSYVHKDDEAEDGRITRLAQLIQREYGLLTGGDEIAIFTDHDLRWGEEWRRRIEDNLDEVTFFIPIVTPRYFRSEECRKELLRFAGHARSLGVENLLLSILYIDTPDLSEDSEDDAKALVAKMQREDWRELRLEPEDSSAHRQAVNKLALRLQEIAQIIDARPTAAVLVPVETLGSDDELGVLDSTALGEELAPLLGQSLVAMGELAKEMQPIIEDAAERMGRAPTTQARLSAAAALAANIRDPSERFEQTASDYAAQSVAIDPAVLRIIRAATELPPDHDDLGEYISLFETLHDVAGSLRGFADSATIMREGVAGLGQITRLLRPTVQTLTRGTRHIQDTQTIFDEWDRLILESKLLPPMPPEDDGTEQD